MPVIGPDDFPPDPVPGAMCAWTLDTTCCTGWDDYPLDVRTSAAAWATEILDAATGRRFAQCPIKLRPCGTRCGWFGGYLTFPVGAPSLSGVGNPWMIPFIDGGGIWRNCTCAGACRCRATCEAHLPGPVSEILEVKVNGLVLDPTAYRLDDSSILVRTDGGECWPECQNLDLADTEEDTWSVTLRQGEALPASGAIAAGKLACEFAKACSGADCALPEQLISLSRNGVQVQVADPQLLLDAGLTGVQEADLFIRMYNPGKLRSRPQVLSPDVRNPRQVSL